MNNSIEIGIRIQSLREERNYSREQLSELAEITSRFLADIEYGKKGFSSMILSQICKALDVSADYILYGKADLSGQAVFLFNQMNESQQRLSISILTDILKHRTDVGSF